jgi:hypothetical protein
MTPMTTSADHITEDQSAVFALLGNPATHRRASAVKRIDTHGAAVFLAGPDAYKVKRAVKFPFMDLSTLARRKAACEAEVTVNRRYTPEIYLGTVPITRDSHGLRLGGDGTVVEWAVHMKRFNEYRTLDRVAAKGELATDLIARIAQLLLKTYAEAKVSGGAGATDALGAVVEETVAELVAAPELFPAAEAATLAAAMTAAYRRSRPLLLARGAAGAIRRCHGDMHMRNIVLIDGAPRLFDGIEFDESIATTDILYDFAFLLMDLCERGYRPAANLLLNRTLWGSGALTADLQGLALLPLFLSLRAAVRAKVEALAFLDINPAPATRRSARRYFAAARAFLAEAPPVLIAIGGLSGSGKTALATTVAPAVGRAPGAVHLRSDIERKRLAGVPETERLPEAAYSRDVTDRVFATLRDQAGTVLAAGHSIIVDAVHRQPDERAALAAVAAAAGVRFIGLWLDAPLDMLVARVSARSGDASDATVEIVARQAAEPLGAVEWHRLDASLPLADLAASTLAACGLAAGRRP